MSEHEIDRRGFLAAGGAAALGAVALGGCGSTPKAATPAARTIRVAHLTDIHVQPELGAEEGMSRCLEHAQAAKPDLILTGGDAVMDVFANSAKRASLLKSTWQGRLRSDCSAPVQHTVGNHDIFGWNKAKSQSTGQEADWGKKFACELFGIDRTYRSFDIGPWKCLALDSVQPKGDGYVAYLDDAQFDWLKAELAATPKTTPILVVSHIPILSLTTLTYGKPRDRTHLGEDYAVPAAEMHTDGTLLHQMFREHGGVKLCLSGHIHLLDHCVLDGVGYICDGAVCGAWWKGACQGVPEGYGLIDLHPDGSYSHEYRSYGWKAHA